MAEQPGFIARIGMSLRNFNVNVDLIATSEVSMSMTVENPAGLEQAVEEMSFYADVTVDTDCAIVSVVGEGLREATGVAGKVFGALSNAEIPVRLISQGASRVNLGLVVDGTHQAAAVQALHNAFFA